MNITSEDQRIELPGGRYAVLKQSAMNHYWEFRVFESDGTFHSLHSSYTYRRDVLLAIEELRSEMEAEEQKSGRPELTGEAFQDHYRNMLKAAGEAHFRKGRFRSAVYGAYEGEGNMRDGKLGHDQGDLSANPEAEMVEFHASPDRFIGVFRKDDGDGGYYQWRVLQDEDITMMVLPFLFPAGAKW